MKLLDATRRVGLHSAGLAVLFTAAACGGVTQFSDKAAIAIAGNPPPPPPPPKKEEPKLAPMRVEMRDNQIVINEKVQFAYNDSTILEVSFSLLNEVADLIKKNPHVKKIEVGGHASSEGSDSHNLRLSDARAKSVMTYLVEKGGVDKARLSSKGYGETKPLVTPDDNEVARERNRRVEFLIIEQDITQKQVEVDPNTGKEKVVNEQTKTVSVEPPPDQAKDKAEKAKDKAEKAKDKTDDKAEKAKDKSKDKADKAAKKKEATTP